MERLVKFLSSRNQDYVVQPHDQSRLSCIGSNRLNSHNLNFMAKKGSASTEKKSADKKGKSKSSSSADDGKGKEEVRFHLLEKLAKPMILQEQEWIEGGDCRQCSSYLV